MRALKGKQAVTTSLSSRREAGMAGEAKTPSHRLAGGLIMTGAKSAFALADLALPRMPGPRLLIYHQVAPGHGPQMSVEPDVFRAQLSWLLARGEIVPLGEALGSPEDAGSERRFVLTFDDGYRGVYEHVFPLLADRGVPFTLYVTTGLVDGTHPRPEPGLDPLDWAQIAEMVGSGLVTVGAHTQTHPDLRGLSRARIEAELDLSNETIERETGVKPSHFAYPKGYWSEVAEPLIRQRYASAVLGAGEPVTSRTDPHRVCRVPVQRADRMFFFRRKIARGMRLEEWARSRVKGYANPSGLEGGLI